MVIIGRLGTSHGVTGWLKLYSFTDPISKIFEYSDWQISHGGKWISLHLQEYKIQGAQLLVKFAECTDREVARTYTNNEIGIPRSILPTTQKDDYYWHDLIGLKVFNQRGVDFGCVQQLLETEAYDLMMMQGDRVRYIPFTKKTVCTVDLENKKIIVDWDENF